MKSLSQFITESINEDYGSVKALKDLDAKKVSEIVAKYAMSKWELSSATGYIDAFAKKQTYQFSLYKADKQTHNTVDSIKVVDGIAMSDDMHINDAKKLGSALIELYDAGKLSK